MTESYQILIIALIFIAVCSISYTFLAPHFSGERQTNKRLKALASTVQHNSVDIEQARRSNIASALKEMDTRQRNRNKLTIEARIAQAGVKWGKKTFLLTSVVLAFVCSGILLILTSSLYIAGVGLFIGGFGLPRFWLTFLCNRRTKKFLEDLPSAIDIIVRGVRVGLPLRDCIRTITVEMTGPVKEEFSEVTDALAMGIPLREAIYRLADNVPLAEAQFIATIISLQQVSGGNLSSAFSNLAVILRERKKLRDKVNALTMEAKASAMIIGSLPIIVAGLVYLTTPTYMEPLWKTNAGMYILLGSASIMGVGIAIMKKMINFKI